MTPRRPIRRAWPTHDAFAIVVAAGVAAGAWWSAPVPLAIAAAATAVALASRRPVLLVAGLVLLASALGARADRGMRPLEPGPVDAAVTLLSDPVREATAVRAEVRLDGRRVEAWARGDAAVVLERHLAGERLAVRGSLSSRPPPSWLQVRHVVARLELDAAAAHGRPNVLHRIANGARRLLEHGARSLAPEPRALLTGLVIGDDRHQSAETADDFRGAGLSHLLAVSGQNVAFVLAAFEPLSRRFGRRTRLVGTVAVLVVFATITRFEPSVLRATVMAGLATTATAIGRPTASIRLLCWAVAALVLVDPFLVRSVGFGLSVSASAGILLASGPIGRAVPGPAPLARAVGVVLAAQVGVAPLLLAVFGSIPVVGPAANVVVEPVAGLVMVWGSSAGLLAGLAPDPVAALVHVPTSWALAWVAGVARHASGVGLGELGPLGAALALGTGVLAVRARARRPRRAAVAAVVGALILLVPAWQLRVDRGPHVLAGVGVLGDGSGPDASMLVLDPDARPRTALRALRARGVDHLGTVVLAADDASARAVVALLGRRIRIDRVVTGAPPSAG